MQVGRVWRSLWSLYSDQQHQLQLRLHTSMEVEMPKITWNLKQLLFNEIYYSSSNLCTRNLCSLPLSGDYLDPTNLVITCPLIPFMSIFWGFRAAYSKKEQILQENENCGPYTFAAWTNIHQPRHVTLFQNSQKWILKKYVWTVWGRNQGTSLKPTDRSWNISEKFNFLACYSLDN